MQWSNFKWVVISTNGINHVTQVVLRLKIPPVGQNDTVCEVNVQTSNWTHRSEDLISSGSY